MKVYGWNSFRRECPAAPNGSHQTREICAAPSFAALKRALKAAGKGVPGQDWYSETGNIVELKVALNEPMTLFWKSASDWTGKEDAYVRAEHLTDPKA